MKIDLPYFYSEILAFRKLMGDKSFWERTPDQRQKAIDGIAYGYLNLTQPDGSPLSQEDIEQAADVLDSTLTEYTRRDNLIFFTKVLTLSA